MDFTREPILESIITPKEGHKLVIRSSKSSAQEEYFVDSVEIVAFGNTLFFRSLERPKAFLVPVSDYEVLEVREARMVLKNAGLDRSIKIGGGREHPVKTPREAEKEIESEEQENKTEEASVEVRPEAKVDKKRDRRRNYRKRRGREDELKEEKPEGSTSEEEKSSSTESSDDNVKVETPPVPNFSALLQPPPLLISETINQYRQNEKFKSAFYLTEEEQYKPHDKVEELLNDEDEEIPQLQEPKFIPEGSPSEESTVEELVDIEQNSLEEEPIKLPPLPNEVVQKEESPTS